MIVFIYFFVEVTWVTGACLLADHDINSYDITSIRGTQATECMTKGFVSAYQAKKHYTF